MSGPSATANPMSAKMAVSSSVTWLMGCTRPASVGASRTGRVTSTVSVLRRVLSAAAANASVTRSFKPLIAGPCALRSSGVIVPSVLSSAETEPLLPSAEMRTASSAASSLAEATAASSSFSSCAMSVMIPAPSVLAGHGRACPGHPRLACKKEGLDARHTGVRKHAVLRTPMAGHDDLKTLRRQRGLGFFHDRLKRRRLANGEVGQNLPVDRHAGLGQSGDKPAVVESERPHRGVQPLDPQRTECALAPFAVAEGVLVRLLDGLLGDADRVLAPAIVAFGGFQDLFMFGVRRDTTLDAGHGSSPCIAYE